MPQAMHKPFCQSALRIRVPVVVVLARQSMPIEQVVKLVPGVLIQFDKACDSPMVVEVGNQAIAEGDIVKTGDKFGIRIGNILKPAERFLPLPHTEEAPQAERAGTPRSTIGKPASAAGR